MTRADLVDWLKAQGCEQQPFDGVNHTGRSIKFYHPKTRRYAYIDLPIDDREVPDYTVAHICDNLFIDIPDCVADQKDVVDGIKNHIRTGNHQR